MSIEIQGPPGRPLPDIGDQKPTGGARSKQSDSQAGVATVTGGKPDKVSLTDQAAQLQALESQISNLPVVDVDRVREVQQTIAASSYTVEPARVADKMLRFEAGLVAKA
jgi:negative regulator of flagellin synthesis FlgM